MKAIHVLALFVLTKCLSFVTNLEVIPETVGVLYFNSKYLGNVSANVRRNGRNSPYVINAEMTTLFTVNDNVVFDLVFFEYLHNEYKRSFVEMHLKGCKGLLGDHLFYLGALLKGRGLRCPLPPGYYVFPNVTFLEVPSIEHLPYKWPFEKAKVVSTAYFVPGNEKIVEAYGTFTFKQHSPKAKKSS